MPANSDTTFWTDLGYTARQRFPARRRTTGTGSRRCATCRAISTSRSAEMRAGLKRGFTPPQVTLQGRDASINNVVDAKPEDIAVLHAVQDHAGHRAGRSRRRCARKRSQVIQGTVQPAYAELLKFWREEYVPGARKTLAAEALPDGKAYYRAADPRIHHARHGPGRDPPARRGRGRQDACSRCSM